MARDTQSGPSMVEATPTAVLLHLTDTHLHAAADSRMRGVTTYQTLLAVLDSVRRDPRWPPDAIIVTGDIVQDESTAGYERFRDALTPLGLPICCIPGNHDDPTLMQRVLRDPPFQVGGEYRVGNWTLVLLSTFAAGDDGGRLGPVGLAELRNALIGSSGRNVLVCMHHHPLPMGSAWLDGVALRDGPEFLAIVDHARHIKGVLWGHVHQVSDRRRKHARFLSTPSTCAQFLPNSAAFALDNRPPGARWLSLYADGRIETEIQWADDVI
jgi:Icc protein